MSASSDGPVRIFVNEIAAFGGVERLILALSRFLHERGIVHEVGCFDDTIGLETFADWPLQVVRLRPGRDIISQRRAFAAFVGFGARPCPLVFDQKGAFYAGLSGLCDLHIHFTDQPSLLSKDISKWAWSAPSTGVRAPSAAVRFRGEIVHRLNRRGVQRARSLIAMTNRAQAELQNFYGVKAAVIRPGVSPGSTSVVAPEERRSLLSVCRLEKGKRVEWIIRAFGLLADRFPDWTLSIIGSGSYAADLKALAAQQNGHRRIVFPGRVSDAELDQAYGDAAVFAMPAVQGYGLPALEALERGAAVVLHEGSAVSEILGGSPWCEIVAGDEIDFKSGLERMMSRVEQNNLVLPNRPTIPYDSEWAAAIACHCGWL